MIHGNVKKALNLGGVQIHGQNPVRPCNCDQISQQFGGYGNPGLILSILTGVAIVGNHCSDPFGGGSSGGVGNYQKLQQVLRRGIGGLYYEDVRPPNVLVYLDRDLPVRESFDLRIAERNFKIIAYLPG
jgi:hypothetical protein